MCGFSHSVGVSVSASPPFNLRLLSECGLVEAGLLTPRMILESKGKKVQSMGQLL